MAKTTKTASATQNPMASITEAFETVQSKMEVPAAARDFVKRTASAAQERAESVHEGLATATTKVENFATAFVGGYADFARGLVESSLANVQHALTTVEKVAGAKSLNEALQIQADYVRESARSNFERAKDAAEAARATVVDGAKNLQSEISALYTKKAA
nr:phasin family protein [Mesorhizobium sp.]